MAGRPPKPIEVHMQEGTYRRDRHGEMVVTTPGHGIIQFGAPNHLTEFQQEVWLELARLLDSIVRESDIPMVEMAAVAYANYREAQKLVDQLGMIIVEFEKGDERTKENPAVRIAQRYQKMFMDTSARLGLSPADRARLGINLGNLEKTKSQLMREQYGDDDEVEGEATQVDDRPIPDAGQERDVLMDAELGYDAPEP